MYVSFRSKARSLTAPHHQAKALLRALPVDWLVPVVVHDLTGFQLHVCSLRISHDRGVAQDAEG